METPITLPPLPEIVARIQSCRNEMAALRRLKRLASAAKDAQVAQQQRPAVVKGAANAN